MRLQEGKTRAKVVSSRPLIHSGPNGDKWFVGAKFHLLDYDIEMGARMWLTTEKALLIARKSLKAMGMQIDGVPVKAVLQQLQTNPFLLAGNEVDVTIKEKVWQGVRSLEIAWINPIGTGEGVASLDDISEKLQGLSSERKGAAAPPPPPPPPVETEDTVPQPPPAATDPGAVPPPGDIPF